MAANKYHNLSQDSQDPSPEEHVPPFLYRGNPYSRGVNRGRNSLVLTESVSQPLVNPYTTINSASQGGAVTKNQNGSAAEKPADPNSIDLQALQAQLESLQTQLQQAQESNFELQSSLVCLQAESAHAQQQAQEQAATLQRELQQAQMERRIATSRLAEVVKSTTPRVGSSPWKRLRTSLLAQSKAQGNIIGTSSPEIKSISTASPPSPKPQPTLKVHPQDKSFLGVPDSHNLVSQLFQEIHRLKTSLPLTSECESESDWDVLVSLLQAIPNNNQTAGAFCSVAQHVVMSMTRASGGDKKDIKLNDKSDNKPYNKVNEVSINKDQKPNSNRNTFSHSTQMLHFLNCLAFLSSDAREFVKHLIVQSTTTTQAQSQTSPQNPPTRTNRIIKASPKFALCLDSLLINSSKAPPPVLVVHASMGQEFVDCLLIQLRGNDNTPRLLVLRLLTRLGSHSTVMSSSHSYWTKIKSMIWLSRSVDMFTKHAKNSDKSFKSTLLELDITALSSAAGGPIWMTSFCRTSSKRVVTTLYELYNNNNDTQYTLQLLEFVLALTQRDPAWMLQQLCAKRNAHSISDLGTSPIAATGTLTGWDVVARVLIKSAHHDNLEHVHHALILRHVMALCSLILSNLDHCDTDQPPHSFSEALYQHSFSVELLQSACHFILKHQQQYYIEKPTVLIATRVLQELADHE